MVTTSFFHCLSLLLVCHETIHRSHMRLCDLYIAVSILHRLAVELLNFCKFPGTSTTKDVSSQGVADMARLQEVGG